MKTNGAIHVVASRSSPAFFRLGDGAVRPAGGTVWVVPGDHVVELDTGTPEQHAVHVLVEPGKVAELRIDAAPAAKPLPAPQSSPPAPAPAPAPPTSERRFPTVPVIVGVSATLVAGVLPVVFGLGAASKRSAAQDAGTTSADYPSLRQDYMDARTRYYVSFSLPAVIAIGSAVWIILSASSSSPSR